MDGKQVKRQLGLSISGLVRLARSIAEEEEALPPANDKPSIDELIVENRVLQRRVEEVLKFKLENYSTRDIEQELVRRRKKIELQRNSHLCEKEE